MDNRKHETKDPEVVIEGAIGRTELFIQKNGKKLIAALIVVVVIVGAYFAYLYLYAQPREKDASKMIYVAEQLFNQQNYEHALAGDGNNVGFLEVIKKYPATPQGNLACHYAGQSYMKLGHFEDAIKYFEKYEEVKGVPAEVINAMNYGLIGDCYVQLKKLEEGAKYYAKATEVSNNALTTPIFLKKQGVVFESLGQNDKALAAYNRIKYDFSSSMEARDIEKYIGRLMQK